MTMTRRSFPAVLLAALLLGALSACGGASVDATSTQPPAANGVAVALSPSSLELAPSAAATFAATVTGAVNTSVRWSVTEAGGGSVSSAGAYVAPSTTGTFHVVATSVADPTRSASATVTVTAAPSPGPDPTPTPPPVALASCASEPLRTTGTVYYVCDCQSGAAAGCTAGNDSNPGTSPSSPWRSYAKAMTTFGSMPAGSTVALCRGGSWTGVASANPIRNTNCRAGATCDLRDYAAPWNTGGEAKPRLTGTGANVFEMGWYLNYTNAIHGYRFLNLDVRNADVVWTIWGGVTDMEICNSDVSDSGTTQYVVTNSTTKRISMHHGVFQRVAVSGGQGFLGACDDCVVDSNVFDHCGGPSNRDHPIYVGSNPEDCTTGCIDAVTGGSGTYHTTQRMRVTNNKVTNSSQSNGVCVGVPIVVHEPHAGLVIENNLVAEPMNANNPGCWGISVGNGVDEPGQFKNVRIARNQIFNGGNSAITIENCQDCTIEDNLIVTPQETVGIEVPSNPYTRGVGPNLVNTRATVRNNTLYYTSSAAGGTGIVVGTEGTGHVVTNNVVHYLSSNRGFSCFRLNLSPSAYAAVDNNVCYTPAIGTGYYEESHGSLASWQAYSGFDAHSRSVDPMFTAAGTDYATANFTPAAGSPLVGAGDASHASSLAIGATPWSATDTGKERGAQPDIGAYQR